MKKLNKILLSRSLILVCGGMFLNSLKYKVSNESYYNAGFNVVEENCESFNDSVDLLTKYSNGNLSVTVHNDDEILGTADKSDGISNEDIDLEYGMLIGTIGKLLDMNDEDNLEALDQMVDNNIINEEDAEEVKKVYYDSLISCKEIYSDFDKDGLSQEDLQKLENIKNDINDVNVSLSKNVINNSLNMFMDEIYN